MTDVAHLRELAERLLGGQAIYLTEEASAALVQAATQIEMLQQRLLLEGGTVCPRCQSRDAA